MDFPDIYENRNGRLYIDGVSATGLAKEFDTPLYVLSERRIRANYRRILNVLVRNYKKVRIHYAAKANSNISVLKILKSEGASIDATSPGEVFLALTVGFPPERILFTGTSVRNDELKFLLDSGVLINIDSLSQLNRLFKMKIPDLLSVRINPGIGAGHHKHCVTAGKASKFGLWEDDAIKTYKTAKGAGVRRFGIHMHIGSGILSVPPFTRATEKILSIAKRVQDETGINFEFVNIGGGLGVPYRPEEKELDLKHFSDVLLTLYRNRIQEYGLGEPFFCTEPGRYIVCDAGMLLTKVNTVKSTPSKKFLGVDAGFNTLIRPAMYGSYHHILVANRMDSSIAETYDVVGPICESGDMLARNRKLPRIQEGDLLAVLNVGAYGQAMSSQYNSRPRAAEILVVDGKHKVVRKRESLNDLMSGQIIPDWLN